MSETVDNGVDMPFEPKTPKQPETLADEKVGIWQMMALPELSGATMLFILTIILFVTYVVRKYFSRSKGGRKMANCWFCNHDQKVPPTSTPNSFTCKFCEQYNGFDKAGDYNTVLAPQHYKSLNDHKFNQFMQPKQNTNFFHSNIYDTLCNKCNLDQFMKLRLERDFEAPDDIESDDDDEYQLHFDQYKKELDRKYPLCTRCEILVKSKELGKYNPFLKQTESYKKKQGQNLEGIDNSFIRTDLIQSLLTQDQKDWICRLGCCIINFLSDEYIIIFVKEQLNFYLGSTWFILPLPFHTTIFATLLLIRFIAVRQMTLNKEHALVCLLLFFFDIIKFNYFSQQEHARTISYTANVTYALLGRFEKKQEAVPDKNETLSGTNGGTSEVGTTFSHKNLVQPRLINDYEIMSELGSMKLGSPKASHPQQVYQKSLVSHATRVSDRPSYFHTPPSSNVGSHFSRSRWNSAPQSPPKRSFSANNHFMDIDEDSFDDVLAPVVLGPGRPSLSPISSIRAGSPDNLTQYDSVSQVSSQSPYRVQPRSMPVLSNIGTPLQANQISPISRFSKRSVISSKLSPSNNTSISAHTASSAMTTRSMVHQNQKLNKMFVVIAIMVVVDVFLFYKVYGKDKDN